MSEFQVGDIVSFSQHAITRCQSISGYRGECYDGHWEVAEVHAQHLRLVQGERTLYANPKFVPDALELVERADPVLAMVHPIDLGERREATHADEARLSGGRSFPRGEAFSPEWDVVPQDEWPDFMGMLEIVLNGSESDFWTRNPRSAPTVFGRAHRQSSKAVDPKVSEWMQPLRFERKRVVHRASSGLREPRSAQHGAASEFERRRRQLSAALAIVAADDSGD